MLLFHMAELFPASRHIEDVIQDGYDVKPMQYLYGGWYVFTSHPVGFWAVAFLFGLVNEAVSRLWPAPLSSGSLRTELFYTLPIEIVRLCLFHGVEALLWTSIAIMVWQRLEDRPLSLMSFLKDWRSVGLIVVCAAVITIVAWTPVMFVTSLPAVGGAVAARITLPVILVLSLVGVILFLYMMVSYAFSYLILVDRWDGIWNALEGSRRVVTRHWWKVAGFIVLFLFLNVETYCLVGSLLEIVSPGWGLDWMCLTEIDGDQGAVVLLMLTALGRAISGCVLAVAYADIYGMPAMERQRLHSFN